MSLPSHRRPTRRPLHQISETQRWISLYSLSRATVAHITDQGGVWPDFTLCGIKWKGAQVARFARTPHFGEPSSLPGNGHALCRSCLLMKEAGTRLFLAAAYEPRGCSCPDCDVCREAGCTDQDACRAGSP